LSRNSTQSLTQATASQEAAQRAHENAERHVATLRTVSLVAAGILAVAVLASFRRRRR